MGLHRKNYYQRRKRMIEQPLEAQEKGQFRVNYIVFAVLAAFFLFAIAYSIIKSHSYWIAVIDVMLLGWCACYSFQSEIHKYAKEKGWSSVAKMTYDPKTEKPCEEALLREERLKNPIDARSQAPYSTSGYKEYPDIGWGSAEQLGLYY